jgi:prophage maintenance system killer protein
MRYLTLGEVVALHRAILERSSGASGMRDLGALESALAQPRATFGNVDLHISLTDKAAAHLGLLTSGKRYVVCARARRAGVMSRIAGVPI